MSLYNNVYEKVFRTFPGVDNMAAVLQKLFSSRMLSSCRN
ncbi:hypothetical protein NHE_0021 [Neorickettsia helminthoeca str. Oregon]|uniref:Uncharacterized protein n=1 Tax=Neorickettsia helminthoeca str. Oregon TaxID=1286528 RepID=X5H389_9RICK|nr:hypothetical protein NHE_0021 [Neorickettsia helminthoeca str. Oregon]